MPAPKWLIWAFLIISFLGFLDATYLTSVHYLGSPIKCAIFTGCETVTTSAYSVVFGIPLALLGALYYLAIFILSLVYLDTRNEKIFRLAAYLTSAGFIASLWLIYLQLFVIHAICLYCVISAISSTSLFLLGLYYSIYLTP